jgi:AGCS family alanine or glycine:cation symporter
MSDFHAWVDSLNSFVWGPAMLVLILGTGRYLQIRLHGMPIRKIRAGLRMVWQGRSPDADGQGEVSPFSALMTCLAGTIGVGNIAGVATAISLGGPGALFWMWMTALVGMATKYAEVVLAVHYRERDADGRWVGGPMYAIRKGLGPRWAWLGAAFALFGGLAGFGIGNMVQSNSIAAAMQNSFNVSPTVTGVVLLVLTGAVVLGGIKRIAAVANWLVPFMAITYILAALVVLVMNAAHIPEAFRYIVVNAFTPTSAIGGFAGAAVMAGIRYGVARGIFSNEAGLGTAGIAQAAGVSSSPVRSGLIGMMGTFFDTLVVCTMTGLAIVVSGAWTSGQTGASLTQLAFQSAMPGIGDEVVAISLAVFALTTIFGWGYYGERCWQYLVGPRVIPLFRWIWTGMVFVGAVTQLDLVWQIADTLNALMAVPNLISLLMLAPVVVQLTRAQLGDVLLGSAKTA